MPSAPAQEIPQPIPEQGVGDIESEPAAVPGDDRGAEGDRAVARSPTPGSRDPEDAAPLPQSDYRSTAWPSDAESDRETHPEPTVAPPETAPSPEPVAALGELVAELGRVEDVQQFRARIEALETRPAVPDLSERVLELEGLLRQTNSERDGLDLRVVRLETQASAIVLPELEHLRDEAARSARFDKDTVAALGAIARVEAKRARMERQRGGGV